MPQLRHNAGHLVGAALPQPGEDVEVEANEESRPTVGSVGADDPAFPFIARAMANLVLLRAADPRDPDTVRRAIAAGRLLHAEAISPRSLPTYTPPPGVRRQPDLGCIYYARIGNRCKIGYTTNLRTRMQNINPEELLAVEPGDEQQERHRHDQFRALRTHGEWFRYEDALVAHVAVLAPASRAEVEEFTRGRSAAIRLGRGRVTVRYDSQA